MEGYVLVAHRTTHVFQRLCVRCVLDIRFGVHNCAESAETGQTLLHHLGQLDQNLDGADENTDVQGIHGKIGSLHLSLGNQITAKHQRNQIHHALEEQIAAHKSTHAAVVCLFGSQKGMIALAELIALMFWSLQTTARRGCRTAYPASWR